MKSPLFELFERTEIVDLFSLPRKATSFLSEKSLVACLIYFICATTYVGGSTPETLAVYSGFFFDDVVLLLDVSS